MSNDNPEFAPDKPESLPRLHVPGLTEDAASLPPEALSGQVPVLTEQVEAAAPTPAPSAQVAQAPDADGSDESTVFSSDHEAEPARLSAMSPVAPNRFAAGASAAPAAKSGAAMAPVAPNRFAAAPAEPVPAPDAEEAVPSEASEPESEAEAQIEAEAPAAQDDAPQPVQAEAQEPETQADTRSKQMQARMGKLSEKIHALHDRLNRLEKPEV